MDSTSDSPGEKIASQRLVSLDALRGFDMLWIVGAHAIVRALDHFHAAESGVLKTVAKQLTHVAWEGFHFYDLIFPLFIFIVGVSLVFSLTKIVEREGRVRAMKRIIIRAVLLWLIGVLYYGGWAKGMESIRLVGVLQRIAFTYLCAGVLFIYLQPRGLVAICVSILVGYWALMTFVPMPGLSQVSFAEGQNLANWIDSKYLPLFKWKGTHDPEGLLSSIPAVATCLLGVFAGLFLRNGTMGGQKKAIWLFGIGVLAVVLGNLWGAQFPIIKQLWTSSYVLVAGGWSAILLSVFYWIIDVMGFQKWAMPFVWIGMNPITIYLLASVIRFNDLSARILSGPVATYFDSVSAGLGNVVIAVGGLLLVIWLSGFMYYRKIFLRL